MSQEQIKDILLRMAMEKGGAPAFGGAKVSGGCADLGDYMLVKKSEGGELASFGYGKKKKKTQKTKKTKKIKSSKKIDKFIKMYKELKGSGDGEGDKTQKMKDKLELEIEKLTEKIVDLAEEIDMLQEKMESKRAKKILVEKILKKIDKTHTVSAPDYSELLLE